MLFSVLLAVFLCTPGSQRCFLPKAFFFFFFFGSAAQLVGSKFLNQQRLKVGLQHGSVESQPLDHQGIPCKAFFFYLFSLRSAGHLELTVCVCVSMRDGQGSLAGCSPWGHKELDTTERLNCRSHFFPYGYLINSLLQRPSFSSTAL